MNNGYVVYDCDIGTDDAWGLLMLIKGEEMHNKPTLPAFVTSNASETKELKQYKILGVTCVQGNTNVHSAAKNALRVLDSVDRCDIPVFKGCEEPILPRTWERKNYLHGKDGFGDLQYENDVNTRLIHDEHAVNAMYDFACKHPNQVDYILVGPLTNFAMCINMYGSRFLDKIRNVYVMGGNYKGKGNITKSAEFNFMMDPEAAHIVLENVKRPIVILPWETCIDGDLGITMEWRFQVIGSLPGKAIKLMNRVERAIFMPRGFVNWITCDALLVAAYIFPHVAISRSRLYHATVELTGTHTRAQMVLDHLKHKEPNAAIILEINREYKHIIAWTAGMEDVN